MQTRIYRSVKIAVICAAGLLAVFFFLSLCSCKKSGSQTPIPLTPLQLLVNSDSTLSLYHRLLLQANEAALLNNDSVTLLIPVNAAFRAAGYSMDRIDSLHATIADNLVRYHFIPARITILPDSGAYTAFNTIAGYPVYGMSDGTHILFNGAQAIRDPVARGKAIVYRLSAVLIAPFDSLDHLLGADSTLSFLAEALFRTGLDSVLSTGDYTLLAPVNSAFRNAGYDSIGAIDSADLTSLTQLMKYQVVKGLYFLNSLAGKPTLSNLQGSPVSVTLQNGLFHFNGGSNPAPATLLSGNRLAGETILVYLIDQVLKP